MVKIFNTALNFVKSEFPIQGRNRMALTPPGTRRLRLEGLEAREMLDASGFVFCEPPSDEQPLMRQLAQAVEADQALPLYAVPFLNSLHNANAESDSIISLKEQDLCDSQSLIDLDTDELFASQGVYVLGEPYISLSFAQKKPDVS